MRQVLTRYQILSACCDQKEIGGNYDNEET